MKDSREFSSVALEVGVATLFYSSDHKLRLWWSVELGDSSNDPLSDDSWKEHRYFDDAYFTIPHPFFLGDLVKVLGMDAVGVVLGPRTQEEKEAEYAKYAEMKGVLDFYDCCVMVESPNGEGRFIHDHVSPIYLEYVTLEEDLPEKDILVAARHLVCGKGSIDNFQRTCEEYANMKRG